MLGVWHTSKCKVPTLIHQTSGCSLIRPASVCLPLRRYYTVYFVTPVTVCPFVCVSAWALSWSYLLNRSSFRNQTWHSGAWPWTEVQRQKKKEEQDQEQEEKEEEEEEEEKEGVAINAIGQDIIRFVNLCNFWCTSGGAYVCMCTLYACAHVQAS